VAAFALPATITAAQAPAVAAAISIRHADLPTDQQKSNPITPQELQQDATLTKCVGGVPVSEALANTQSPNFLSASGASVTINAGTEILPSTALVATDFAAITGTQGIAKAFAYRFTVIVTQTKRTTTLILPIYVDVIGFAYGQVEVSLSIEAVGSKPPAALERRLAALLVARAKTAIG
jgi:hypothetical protein